MIENLFDFAWRWFFPLAFLVVASAVWSLAYCCVQKPKWPFFLAAIVGYGITSIVSFGVVGIPLGIGLASCFKKPRSRRIGSAIGGLIGFLFGLGLAHRDWATANYANAQGNPWAESFLFTLCYNAEFISFVVLACLLCALTGAEVGLRLDNTQPEKESEKVSQTS